MHEIVDLLFCWEALIDELEWVVVESLVFCEVVLLSLKELVDFDEVRSILTVSVLNTSDENLKIKSNLQE